MDFYFLSMDDLLMEQLYTDTDLLDVGNVYNYDYSSLSFADPDSDYIPDSDNSSNESYY